MLWAISLPEITVKLTTDLIVSGSITPFSSNSSALSNLAWGSCSHKFSFNSVIAVSLAVSAKGVLTSSANTVPKLLITTWLFIRPVDIVYKPLAWYACTVISLPCLNSGGAEVPGLSLTGILFLIFLILQTVLLTF